KTASIITSDMIYVSGCLRTIFLTNLLLWLM
ncbi:MAG: hypothetical protein ACI9C4_002322, partial [Paraglaciecola sp.]